MSVTSTSGIPTMSDVVDHIEMTIGSLSEGESKVASVILDDVSAATESTITQLAGRAGTSVATVTRFCRSIGLTGYPQLRRQLAAAVERRRARGSAETEHSSLVRLNGADSTADVMVKLAAANVRAIEHTLRRIDAAELDRAVVALGAARRVLVCAVGACAPVAIDAAAKLNLADCSAVVCTDPRTALMNATRCTPDDVALVISHRGHAELVDVVAAIGDRGSTVIAITSDGASPIAKRADIVLLSSAHDIIGSGAAGLSSRIALLTIVDALFVSLAPCLSQDPVRVTDVDLQAVGSYRMGPRRVRH